MNIDGVYSLLIVCTSLPLLGFFVYAALSAKAMSESERSVTEIIQIILEAGAVTMLWRLLRGVTKSSAALITEVHKATKVLEHSVLLYEKVHEKHGDL